MSMTVETAAEQSTRGDGNQLQPLELMHPAAPVAAFCLVKAAVATAIAYFGGRYVAEHYQQQHGGFVGTGTDGASAAGVAGLAVGDLLELRAG